MFLFVMVAKINYRKKRLAIFNLAAEAPEIQAEPTPSRDVKQADFSSDKQGSMDKLEA